MVVARAFSAPMRSSMNRFTPKEGDEMYLVASNRVAAKALKLALSFMILVQQNFEGGTEM
jgi:hypothetical protein